MVITDKSSTYLILDEVILFTFCKINASLLQVFQHWEQIAAIANVAISQLV